MTSISYGATDAFITVKHSLCRLASHVRISQALKVMGSPISLAANGVEC
jgi:hypothetical protein